MIIEFIVDDARQIDPLTLISTTHLKFELAIEILFFLTNSSKFNVVEFNKT
jgi:hypothetical protein